ncbi:DUF547 domain-containing protein [Candidatus Nitrospira bockiana]
MRAAPGLSLILIVLMAAGCSSAPRAFSPRDPIPLEAFSEQPFNEVLHAHVADGVVDYPAIARDDRFRLHLRRLARFDPNSLPSRAHSLTFWINVYNAYAIKGILDGYSPRTLWGRYRYFISVDHEIGGRRINLYDLERDLLIPDFQDPRVHFAIVCASRSCPKLRSEVYSAERLNEQLEASARAFVNDPTRNRFDRDRKVAHLSMIFRWFEQDFARRSGSLLKYVAQYVSDPDLARELPGYRVEFLDYDWSLNGVAGRGIEG